MIIKSIRKAVRKNRFLKDVGVLTSGTLVAQGLAVLALPLLTRLYSPEDFDLLAIYTSLLGMLAVAASLRFNIAVALPEREEIAMDLLKLALFSSSALSLLVAAIVGLYPDMVTSWLGRADFHAYLWMVPLGLFLASGYDSVQYWATRQRRFALITKTRISRAVGGVGSQVGFSGVVPSAWGLIFGQMLYGGLGLVGLFVSIWRNDRRQLLQFDFRRLSRTAREYRRYPFVSVPEAIMNTAANELPIILIAAAAAGPEAGFLMLALRVLGLPMAMIGSSVSQVFLAEAPARQLDGTLRAFTIETMCRLGKIGSAPLLVVGVLAPVLVPTLFGAQWSRTGELISWLTPWFIFQFVSSPVSVVLHVIGKLPTAMFIQVVGAIVRIGGVMWALDTVPGQVAEVYAILSALFYATIIPVILRALASATRGGTGESAVSGTR